MTNKQECLPRFKTATDEIKYTLIHKGSIDQMYCYQHRITTRLGGIIYQLRRQGMRIETEIRDVTTRYGEKTRVAIYHFFKK